MSANEPAAKQAANGVRVSAGFDFIEDIESFGIPGRLGTARDRLKNKCGVLNRNRREVASFHARTNQRPLVPSRIPSRHFLAFSRFLEWNTFVTTD